MRPWTAGTTRVIDRPPLGRMIAGYKVDSIGVPQTRTWDPYVLVFTTAGGAWFRDVQGRGHDLVPGDALLLFPGLGHSFAPHPGGRWSEFYVIFSGPAFAPWYREHVLTADHPVARLEPAAWWLRRIQEAVEADDDGGDGFQPIYRFQALLAEVHQALMRPRLGAAARWLSAVKAELERSDAGRPDLDQVGEAVGTSSQVLRKRFRALTGQSPHQWHAALQMSRACALLKDQSVRAVAERLGFCDQFQFSRRFKQLMGAAPLEFQRSLR